MDEREQELSLAHIDAQKKLQAIKDRFRAHPDGESYPLSWEQDDMDATKAVGNANLALQEHIRQQKLRR